MNIAFDMSDNTLILIMTLCALGGAFVMFVLIYSCDLFLEKDDADNHAALFTDFRSNRGSPTEWDEGLGIWHDGSDRQDEARRQLVADQRAGKN